MIVRFNSLSTKSRNLETLHCYVLSISAMKTPVKREGGDCELSVQSQQSASAFSFPSLTLSFVFSDGDNGAAPHRVTH